MQLYIFVFRNPKKLSFISEAVLKRNATIAFLFTFSNYIIEIYFDTVIFSKPVYGVYTTKAVMKYKIFCLKKNMFEFIDEKINTILTGIFAHKNNIFNELRIFLGMNKDSVFLKLDIARLIHDGFLMCISHMSDYAYRHKYLENYSWISNNLARENLAILKKLTSIEDSINQYRLFF